MYTAQPIHLPELPPETIGSELPTPKEIAEKLDACIQGQAIAKQNLANAAYRHYLTKQPTPILLVGPSGSGKTELVKTLAKLLDVLFYHVSATSLVQVGYKGRTVEEMLESVLSMAGGDRRRAQNAILFLDEIDKIKAQPLPDGGPDVSGEGVQNALLTLLEGGKVNLPRSNVTLDTSGIFVVCAGVFGDLAKQGTKPGEPPTVEELQQFGFIPELIGRFTSISKLHPLTHEDFFHILTTKQSSIFHSKKQFFALHGVELIFTEAALRAIAYRAYHLGLGVRGLSRILNQALSDLEYSLPELMAAGVDQVVINDYALEEGVVIHHYTPGQRVNVEAQTTVLELRRTFANCQDGAEVDDNLPPQTLEEAKQMIGWHETTGSARKWWESFEKENSHRSGLILKLAQELAVRKATISEFFLAYVYSSTDNIQANLHYLDYTRLKKEEEQRKKKG